LSNDERQVERKLTIAWYSRFEHDLPKWNNDPRRQSTTEKKRDTPQSQSFSKA